MTARSWRKSEVIDKLERLTQGTHMINILVRRGGTDEEYEGDFLKDVLAYLKAE
jgi:hypothetical protein